MKKYDFLKAKKFIDEHSDEIVSASLGMDEDWFWTAKTVFKDGKYTVDLTNENTYICGIQESRWATPTLEVVFKNDSVKKYNCYLGQSECGAPPPFFFGCISQEQGAIKKLQPREEIE